MKTGSFLMTTVMIAGLGVATAAAQQPTPTATQSGMAPALDQGAKTLASAAGEAAPKKFATFDEWISWMRKPRPYPKATIVRLDDKHAYPHRAVPWKMEIVREEGDTVWMRLPPPEDPDSVLHKPWLEHERTSMEAAKRLAEGLRKKQLDFFRPVVPPPSVDELTLAPAGAGLPSHGLWQMAMAVADMNEDGVADIVVPPMRKGRAVPHIYLGKGDGTFSEWRGLKWPSGSKVPYDYGGVNVADFDHDGHMDVVLAIHLKGQFVFYGDGKGDFTRFKQLPRHDPRLYSRSVAVGDFDGDGWQDLAFIAEINYDMALSNELEVPTVWVVRNVNGKRWEVKDDGLPSKLMADRIVAADVDGNGKDDLVLGSNAFGWRFPLALNGGGWKWKWPKETEVLSDAYHYDGTVLPAEPGTKVRKIVMTFQQGVLVPDLSGREKPTKKVRSGLAFYTYTSKGTTFSSQFLPLTEDQYNPYWRVAVGDLDGDGRDDLVTARKQGPLEVYLRQADGSWFRERSPELASFAGHPFDIKVKDFNGDGRKDILVMVAGTEKAPGGILLWLNHRSAP